MMFSSSFQSVLISGNLDKQISGSLSYHIGISFQCNVMIMREWDSNSRPLHSWDVCQNPKRYVITATIFYFILYIFLQNFGCLSSNIATFHHLSLKLPKSWDSKLYFDIISMNLRSPAPYEKLVQKGTFSILKSLFCIILTKNVEV